MNTELCRFCCSTVGGNGIEKILCKSKLQLLEDRLLDISIYPDSTLCWICRLKLHANDEILRNLIERDCPEILPKLLAENIIYMKVEPSSPKISGYHVYLEEDVEIEKKYQILSSIKSEEQRSDENFDLDKSDRNKAKIEITEARPHTKQFTKIGGPGKDILYACNYCSHKTARLASVKLHLLRHQDIDDGHLYKCTQCSFTTKWRSTMPAHMLRHRKPEDVRIFECANCPYSSIYKKHLRRHMKRHNDRRFKCDFCDFRCASQPQLRGHMKELHNRKPKGNRRHGRVDGTSDTRTADVETNTSRLIETLRFGKSSKTQVIKRTEVSIKKTYSYECRWCGFKTPKNDSMKQHIIRHRGNNDIDKGFFQCPDCSYTAKYQRFIEAHMNQCHQS